MPMCSYPDCKEYAIKKNDRCELHLVKNKAEKKEESVFLQKQRRSEEARLRNEAESAERSRIANEKAKAQERLLALQAEVIRDHRQTWNALVQGVVAQVLVLRQTDPNANAGNNAVGNTPGGTGNPVSLVMTGPTHGVSRGEITSGMAGFDSSDSGVFKFRRQGVLVHCC